MVFGLIPDVCGVFPSTPCSLFSSTKTYECTLKQITLNRSGELVPSQSPAASNRAVMSTRVSVVEYSG